MYWKKGDRVFTVLSLVLVGLGILLALLPYNFWVTGVLISAFGVFLLVLRFVPNALVRNVLLLLAASGLVVLEVLMGLIAVWGTSDPQALQCDTAIVLGAQVNGRTPSMMLRTRLDAALDYLQENPDAVLILSGGQGSGEEISEAQAMYDYLTVHGADPAHLRMEAKSSNTRENLLFSHELAEQEGLNVSCVCLITNEFHAARAQFLASRMNMAVCSYSAASRPWLFRMNYYLREIPAFLKAWIQTA